MRILIINSEYPPVGGGASTASGNIARILAEEGNEVVVLTTRYNQLPKDSLENGVRVLRGPSRRSHKERSTAWEQGWFIVLGALRALPLMFRWRPQITLAFFGAPSGIIALFLHFTFGVPYIISLRGGDVPGFRSYDFWLYHWLITPLLKVVWSHAEAVVANSQGLRQLAMDFYSQVEIGMIPNGVDIHQFKLTEHTWQPPHMVTVGRLVHQKGLDLLFEALSGINQHPWKLTIVGAGPRRQILGEMVKKMGIAANVNFVGWKDNEELPPYYQAASIFVLPSRNEGMPNAMLEAMASGLPVVASDISGNQELVLEGQTGFLVPSESPAELRQALMRLMGDEELCCRMGAAGRKMAESAYSWENTAAKYLEIARRALGGE
jgi:glycosyltransferase involved in cell wall biosynthesis